MSESIETQPQPYIQNEPTTPIPSEPPKTNRFMVPMLVGVIMILLASTTFFSYQYFTKPPANDAPQTGGSPTAPPEPSPANNSAITPNLEVYKNDSLGFSFQYPSSFTITDTLQKNLDEIATTKNNLILEDKLSQQQYNFMINPDGFGPFFPDKTITVAYSDIKGVYTTKTEDTEGQENSDPKKYSIIISGKINDHTSLLGFASVPRGEQSQKELMKTANQILSTFKFTNPTAGTNSFKLTTYSNPKVGFSIQYPTGWRKVEAESVDWWIGFGPSQIGEDTLFGIQAYSKPTHDLASIIDTFGKQFADRIQREKSVTINGHRAVQVATTTPSDPNWYSEQLIFETETGYYVLSNGAINDESMAALESKGVPKGYRFGDFSSTFKFTD